MISKRYNGVIVDYIIFHSNLLTLSLRTLNLLISTMAPPNAHFILYAFEIGKVFDLKHKLNSIKIVLFKIYRVVKKNVHL